MIKNPYWLPFCALYAFWAVYWGMRCIDNGGDVLYALASLVDCLCFGYGLAKARGLSLWPS